MVPKFHCHINKVTKRDFMVIVPNLYYIADDADPVLMFGLFLHFKIDFHHPPTGLAVF